MRSKVVIILFAFLADGVFGDTVTVESVLEGNSVSLNSAFTEMMGDDLILWRFGAENTLIAQINVMAGSISVYDHALDGRFRDRLNVNHQTGSLIITNTRTEHTGLYKLQSNSVSKSFSLTLCGVFGDTAVSVMEGDHVTLNTGVTKQHNETMRWYFDGILIAMIDGSPDTSCLYDGEGGRFRDRLEVDYETGSLIITNTRSEHAGRYEAEHIRSESSGKTEKIRPGKCDSTKIHKKNSNSEDIIKSFSLTVSASDSGKNKNEGLTKPQDKETETSSGPSPGVVAGIVGGVVGVLLVAAAVAVLLMKIDRPIFRKLAEILRREKQVSKHETQNEKSLMI